MIDGSKTPDLISDEVAIRLFFLAAVEPPQPTAEQLSRLRAKFARVKLAPSDLDVCIAEMGRLHGQISSALAKKDAVRAAVKANAAQLQDLVSADAVIDKLTKDSYTSLQQHLSMEGAQRLRAHIAYVKTRIKLYNVPANMHQ